MDTIDEKECWIHELLYLLSKGININDSIKLIEMKYDTEINVDLAWLNVYCKNKFGQPLDQLIYRRKKFIAKLYASCSSIRKGHLNTFIGGLDDDLKRFLRYILRTLPWQVRNFPLLNMLVGSYCACEGKILDKKLAFEILIKAGFILRGKITDGELEQWLEINESDFINLSKLLEDRNERDLFYSEEISIDKSYLPFIDLLLKLSQPSYIFPRNIIVEIYNLNFNQSPPRRIPNLVWSDDTYFYLCPKHIEEIKKIIQEEKVKKIKELGEKLEIKQNNITFRNGEIGVISTDDLKVIFSPWIFFSEKSIFTSNLNMEKIMEVDESLLIILRDQYISSFIRVIETSNIGNISILSLAPEVPEIFFSTNTTDIFRKKIENLLDRFNIPFRDVTCDILKQVFPLTKEKIVDFASKRFTIEGLKLLLEVFDSNIEDIQNLISVYLERNNLEELSKKIGYPSSFCL